MALFLSVTACGSISELAAPQESDQVNAICEAWWDTIVTTEDTDPRRLIEAEVLARKTNIELCG